MRNSNPHPSARRARAGLCAAAAAFAAFVLPATALGANDTSQFSVTAGSLTLASAPNVPNFNALTITGQAQTINAQMSNYTVADASGTGAGWNVTVVGDATAGKSPVFKQWNTTSQTYVGGGATLAANSITLNSTSAGESPQNGSTGAGPTHSCNSGCFVDAASPVKVASAATGSAGMGTYQLNGYTASSLSLNAPTTVKALSAGEAYHLDLVWSLNSGP